MESADIISELHHVKSQVNLPTFHAVMLGYRQTDSQGLHIWISFYVRRKESNAN